MKVTGVWWQNLHFWVNYPFNQLVRKWFCMKITDKRSHKTYLGVNYLCKTRSSISSGLSLRPCAVYPGKIRTGLIEILHVVCFWCSDDLLLPPQLSFTLSLSARFSEIKPVWWDSQQDYMLVLNTGFLFQLYILQYNFMVQVVYIICTQKDLKAIFATKPLPGA